MEQNKVIANQDLLLCENKYFLEKNKLENILNFHKKDDKQKQSTLKTQTVSSNGKNFLSFCLSTKLFLLFFSFT